MAPTPTTSAPIERKASAGSTAATLWAGGEALAGNGEDTDNNSADFVLQTNGRNPQNTSNPPEPSFGSGGDGTGRGTAAPATVFTSHAVPSIAISIGQDDPYTLTDLTILIPPDFTWSHTLGDVALSGAAFAGATPTIVGDEIHISGAAVTTVNGGVVTVSSLTAPVTKGTYTFTLKTAVAAGTLAQVVQQPKVRVLNLVPILDVHVNDPSTGVCIAPYAVGTEVTVQGIVTVNWSSTNTDFYVQDETAGISIFTFGAPPVTLTAGDEVIVTGSVTQFRGLTELTPDFSVLQILSSGNPIPEPLVLTCADVNATFQIDGTEPNEGRLVRVNGITSFTPGSGGDAGTMTDATGSTSLYIPAGYPPTPSQFDVIGILKQYKPGTPTPGPPFKGDYEVSPRSPDDIIGAPGPIILTTPYEDHIQAASVQLHWTTDVASSSIVQYGLTSGLGSTVSDPTLVTQHSITVPGLTPATAYFYSAGSEDVNGTTYAPTRMFSTASPPAASGAMLVYFNKSIDPTLQWLHQANGNWDLPTTLSALLFGAQHSIDAAMYNLSGTPGATLANQLVLAKNRGVSVRVICEQDNRSNAPFNTIAAAGIPIITDTFDAVNNGAGLMHNKFMVIDGRGGDPEQAHVWTGSWNPSDPGTNDDYQNSIDVQDQALANTYTLEFNEMWGSDTETPNAAASRFGARKKNNTPHKFNIGGHDVECYFSPSDATTSHIISTINAAQQSIGFQLLTITRDDIRLALVSQKTAGLAVRGDMDNSTDSGSQYAALVAGNVDVGLKTGSGLLHHKYMIADAESPTWDAVTLTGSHNWSASAENTNNENTLIIHDPDVTNQYLQEFVARYHQFGGQDVINLVSVDPIAGVPNGRVFLAQNFPNPALGRTSISYSIPSKQQVVLKLFDIAGREVRTLVNQEQSPGSYKVEFGGGALQSGVYFYRLQTAHDSQQRKMLFMR